MPRVVNPGLRFNHTYVNIFPTLWQRRRGETRFVSKWAPPWRSWPCLPFQKVNGGLGKVFEKESADSERVGGWDLRMVFSGSIRHQVEPPITTQDK